jgi:hypothetical protein
MRGLLLAAIALAGCERASFRDCAVTCTPVTGCPDGFACGPEGLCRIEGAGGTCADVLSDAMLPSICEAGHETKLTGVVNAPNGTLPLPGVTVYVARTDPGALPAGPTCDRCDGMLPGTPVVVTTTDTDGSFTLDKVPTGNLRVVIQTGKWRRQVTVPNVTECEQRALDADATRLPKNHTEGDIPKVALGGGIDALECLPLSLGIDPAEITDDTGAGRFQLYSGALGTTTTQGGSTLTTTATLVASATKLAAYDLVVLGCDGEVVTRPAASAQNLVDYTTAGGRLYLTHYGGTWFAAAPTPWPSVGTFSQPSTTATTAIDSVDTTSATGMSLAKWLTQLGASSTPGRINITEPRQGCTAIDTSIVQPLLILDPTLNPTLAKDFQSFELATPIGGQSCGRIVFSDIHFVSASNNMAYPLECTVQPPLSPQQLAIAYLIFELGACSR